MKVVLPTLTGKSYKDLEIQAGDEASALYMNVTFVEDVAAAEKKKVYDALEKYCGLDTEGMILVLERLIKL